jgi:hypothetical protein
MPENRYKEDVETSKRRVEAWWAHEIVDRVVIQVTAPRDDVHAAALPSSGAPEQDQESLRRYFTDPEVVIPRLKARLADTYFGGEAFPVMYPVSINMVAILSNYLGCPMRFVNENTTWSDHILEDWEQRPTYRYDPTNEWWLISEWLLKAGVEACCQRASDGYYVGVPDLNGPTEMLSRLRSPQHLALDLYDCPQYIKPALAEINQVWYEYWRACTAITGRLGGNFHWMGIWSDLPSTDLQSDFSCMMSPAMFDEYFLPFIDEQTHMVERTIYHLDGPGAVKHLDSLLGLPRLDGIQWVPGAGAKPTVEWIPLLKKIQDAGKLVYAYCEEAHVRRLLHELRPEGLMLVTSCDSVGEAEQLLENVSMWM